MNTYHTALLCTCSSCIYMHSLSWRILVLLNQLPLKANHWLLISNQIISSAFLLGINAFNFTRSRNRWLKVSTLTKVKVSRKELDDNKCSGDIRTKWWRSSLVNPIDNLKKKPLKNSFNNSAVKTLWSFCGF